MTGLHHGLLTLGLAWQTLSPEAADHARAGIAARQAGNLEGAIVEFKKAAELAPTVPAAYVNLGAIYIEDKKYDQSIAPLKHALELNPDLPGAEQMLGFALLTEGFAAESIPYFQKAGVTDLLGMAELKTGKLPEAVNDLRAALAKRPDDPELLYALGRASGLLSKESLDTLEARFPNSARAHQSLAENYAVLRQVPEAEREYKAALQLAPQTRGLHLALGQLYAAAADWTKAETEFAAEASLEPGDAEAQFRLGNALLEGGKIKAAREAFSRSDKLQPEMPETLYGLGKAAFLDSDAASAESTWHHMLAIENNTLLAGQAHFGLAGLYRKQGKAAAAAAEMKEFQRIRDNASQK